MLTLTQNGLGIVKAFEGCLRPTGMGTFQPYICPAGVLTIGWGHTNHHSPKFDSTARWSQEKCDEVLAGDMKVFERHVLRQDPTLGNNLGDQNRFEALVSWAYNTGGPANSSVWQYVRQRNDKEAVARLKRWNKGGGKVLAGLVRRRDAESELYVGRIAQAFKVAGAKVPSAVDPSPRGDQVKPKPPARDVAKRVNKEATGTVIGAGGATAAGSQSKYTGADYVMIGACVVFAVFCIALVVINSRKFINDWA